MANSEAGQAITFVVPGDPDQNTGGYRYVRRIAEGLSGFGLAATRKGLQGSFPVADDLAKSSMEDCFRGLEDASTVVLDGLAMGAMPGILAAHAGRLHLIALVHHPLADETGLPEETRDWLFEAEREALATVAGVITTSSHTAQRLRDYHVPVGRIRVVEPGADTILSTSPDLPDRPPAGHSSDVMSNLHLLCVAHLSPRKAQLDLLEALADLQHRPWHCTFAGSMDRDPLYARQLQESIHRLGLDLRITLAGELDDQALARAYAEADLFVLPSLYEGYGMVIDEAQAVGLPVITTDGGALATTGNRPGIRQYPAGDVNRLRALLEHYLEKPEHLAGLAREAADQARSLRTWQQATTEFRDALAGFVSAPDPTVFDSDWLSLREPADHKARNRELTADLVAWARRMSPPLTIADLGTGTGSNARYLMPILGESQQWVLMDQDETLLSRAAETTPLLKMPTITRACHLTAEGLENQLPGDVGLVTASALIDLMSARWLEALAAAATKREAGVFIVLSYAGRFELSPADKDDRWILATVNAHQHGDKGAGSALGPDATEFLQSRLQASGYDVSLAYSPWHLTPEQSALQVALLAGWQQAVVNQSPGQRQRAGQWFETRFAQARAGQLSIRVDHQDLFARPADRARN